jgi:hypothetical protein
MTARAEVIKMRRREFIALLGRGDGRMLLNGSPELLVTANP